MTTQNLSIFKALGAKMDYLNQKQRVIAQNIANADTPGYQPQTLAELNFDRALRNVDKSGKNGVSIDTSNPGHMPRPLDSGVIDQNLQKQVYETTPDGNAVILEEQMINAQKNIMDYSLMTNLYQKQVGMIRTALS